MGNIVIITGGMILLSFMMMAYFMSRYKRCPPDKILVIFGRVEDEYKNGVKLVIGGAAFVWPVIQDYMYLDLNSYETEFNIERKTKDGAKLNISAQVMYAISNQKELAEKAAVRLLYKTREEIEDIATAIINGQLNILISENDVVEIALSKDEFLKKMSIKIAEALGELGLQLINVKLNRFDDKDRLIDKYEEKFKNNVGFNEVDENFEKKLETLNQRIEKNRIEKEELLDQKLKLLLRRK